MIVEIRYRIDTSEVYEVDVTRLANTDWPAVLREVLSVEAAGNTVLQVRRIDLD